MAKQQGKQQGKAKAPGKTKAKPQGKKQGKDGSAASSKTKPLGKQQGQAKPQGKKHGKDGSKATTKPGTAKPDSKASAAPPPTITGDAGAAQARQPQHGQEAATQAFPQHRHHFKTWFFHGRPGMMLSSIQIDIQAGAVHETWSRTE